MQQIRSFIAKLRLESKPKYNIKWWTDRGETRSDWWNGYATDSLTLEEIEHRRQSMPHRYVTHVKIEGMPPRSLHQWLPDVTHLYIRVEKIEHADAVLNSVRQLSELQFLHLESNHISLPSLTSGLLNEVDRMDHLSPNPEFLKLCKLQVLEIVNSDLNVFDTSAFLSFFKKSLIELKLHNCGLKQVPESISEMTHLNKLDLSSNNLSAKGLPNLFDCLPCLDTLNLANCSISTLPTSFQALANLKTLDLSHNHFEKLPRLAEQLKRLEKLSLRGNAQLRSLDFVLSLPDLKHLIIKDCRSLAWPPYATCVNGFEDIKQYLRETKTSTPAVVVIGQKDAGKSSLIHYLQTSNGKETSAVSLDLIHPPEMSNAFDFEKVTIDGRVFNFVDLGGNEPYESSYELALGGDFVPIVVVSMWEYSVLCQRDSAEEAIQRTFSKWLAFLYLSRPDLMAPILVMTHKDKFDESQISLLKAKFLKSAADITQKLATENERIRLFSSESLPFCVKENMHCIGLNSTVADFNDLKSAILKSSEHAQQVPKLWGNVQVVIKNEADIGGSVSDLLDKVNNGSSDETVQLDQLQEILTYMRDCGTLLWYKDYPALSDFIIYKPNAISKLLSIFYSCRTEARWNERAERFRFSSNHDDVLDCQKYETLVAEFKNSGVMNERLLCYLLRTETAFTTEILRSLAVNVLKAFGFIYNSQDSYKFPYFVTSPFNLKTTFSDANLVGLTAEIGFRGLSPTQPVYFQWLAATLLATFQNEQLNVSVEKTELYVLFLLMFIKVSCNRTSPYFKICLLASVEEIYCAWQRFVDVTNHILRLTKEKFAAAKLICEFQCPHCALKGDIDPIVIFNPAWCVLETKSAPKMCGTEQVSCRQETDVLAALKHPPCKELTDDEIEKLKEYVVDLKRNPGGKSNCDEDQPVAAMEELLCSATTDYTTPYETDIERLPDELLQELRRLFKRHASSSPMDRFDPNDTKHLIIMGDGIQGMKPDLDELNRKFPAYKFSLKETGGQLYTNQFGSKSPAKVERKVPNGVRTHEWMQDQFATTELLISAEEMSKENPKPHGVVFAVLPAHLLLQKDEPETYARVHNKIAISRSEVEGRSTRTRFVIHIPNGSKGIDLRHPPLFCYRQWFSAKSVNPHRDVNDNTLAQGVNVRDCPVEECPAVHNGECHHLYMNDMALMRLEIEDAVKLHQIVKEAQPQRVDVLRDIGSKESVEKMCRRKHKIVIGEAEGHLIRMPAQILRDEADRKYGIHLPFVLTSRDENNEKHKLRPGDCGLVLYYKKSGSGTCKPMGLFVGELLGGELCSEPVYQAIVLSQAFKDIEFDYPHQLHNIRLFQTTQDTTVQDATEDVGGAAATVPAHTRQTGGRRSGPRPPQSFTEHRYWPN